MVLTKSDLKSIEVRADKGSSYYDGRSSCELLSTGVLCLHCQGRYKCRQPLLDALKHK